MIAKPSFDDIFLEEKKNTSEKYGNEGLEILIYRGGFKEHVLHKSEIKWDYFTKYQIII